MCQSERECENGRDAEKKREKYLHNGNTGGMSQLVDGGEGKTKDTTRYDNIRKVGGHVDLHFFIILCKPFLMLVVRCRRRPRGARDNKIQKSRKKG